VVGLAALTAAVDLPTTNGQFHNRAAEHRPEGTNLLQQLGALAQAGSLVHVAVLLWKYNKTIRRNCQPLNSGINHRPRPSPSAHALQMRLATFSGSAPLPPWPMPQG